MKPELSNHVVKDPDAPPTKLLGDPSHDRWGLSYEDRKRMSDRDFEQYILCLSIDGKGPLAEVYKSGIDAIDMRQFYRFVAAEVGWFNRTKAGHTKNFEASDDFKQYQQKHSPSSNLNRM